jgi:hypothetical protein
MRPALLWTISGRWRGLLALRGLRRAGGQDVEVERDGTAAAEEEEGEEEEEEEKEEEEEESSK